MSIDTMNHDQAVSSHAAERYIVGELSDAERESFEGHYFDCPVCFEQISADKQLIGEFLSHAREVLAPEPEKSWLAQMLEDLRRPAPVFVSALLLCALGIGVYQQSVISGLRSPRVDARYFLPQDSRGGAAKPINVSRKAGLSLTVVFTSQPEFVAYRAQIVADSGKIKYKSSPSQPVGDSLTIDLPADALAPGDYYVVVQGVTKDGNEAVAATSGRFELSFAD